MHLLNINGRGAAHKGVYFRGKILKGDETKKFGKLQRCYLSGTMQNIFQGQTTGYHITIRMNLKKENKDLLRKIPFIAKYTILQ